MAYQRKNPILALVSNPAFLTIAGFLVLLLISWPLVRNVKKQLEVNDEISNLRQEIDSLEQRNTELNGLITYLNSDQFAEEQARLNLNYKKEGEEVVVIKDKTEDGNTNAAENSDSPSSIYSIKGLENKAGAEPVTNPEKWLHYFLRK
jgi:cell division protein FtsB